MEMAVMLNMGLNLFEVKKMKVFLSWSGKRSNLVAQELKKWIPCLIDVDVFFSSEDIEKGENWTASIAKELSSCSYGIICLTQENKDKAWINFEAGAISKALDSHLSAILIDIVPSDIQGPLKLYQATKLEKEDFFALIKSINSVLGDSKNNEELLRTRFNAMWEEIRTSIEKSIEATGKKEKKTDRSDKKEQSENKSIEATEEILQLLRQQSAILNDPDRFFSRFENVGRKEIGDYNTLSKILQEIENAIGLYPDVSETRNGKKKSIFRTMENGEIITIEDCATILSFLRTQLKSNFELDMGERNSLIARATKSQIKCIDILLHGVGRSNKKE